jgi:uncharacterized protein YfcZ (UPF0381/DUF406 family)
MKKFLYGFTTVIVVILVFGYHSAKTIIDNAGCVRRISSIVKNDNDQNVYSVDKQLEELKQLASESEANCPVQIMEGLFLDSVSAIDANSLLFHYSIVDFSVSDIEIDVFHEGVKQQLLLGMNSTASGQKFKNKKIIQAHRFTDKDQIWVTTVHIHPSEIY